MVLAIVLSGAVAPATPPEAHITTSGWGPVRVGMRATDFRLAQLGFKALPRSSASNSCDYLQSADVPDLRVMVEAGQVVRVETSQARYSTPSGVRVGDSEASARHAYGTRAIVRPHKYVEGGIYLIIYSAERTNAVVLEVVKGSVASIRGGLVPAVEYVEGCS